MTIYTLSTQALGLPDQTLLTTTNAPPIGSFTTSGTPAPASRVDAAYPVLGPTSILQGGSVSGTTAYGRIPITGSQLCCRFAFQIPTLPNAAVDIFRVDNSASQGLTIGLNPSNQIQLKSASATVQTFSTALTAGTVYVLYMDIIVGGSTTTGTLRARMWNAGETTKLWDTSGSVADGTVNAGTTNLTTIRLPGKLTGGSTNYLVAFNHFYADNSISSGAPALSRTLTVNAGPDQTVEPWSTVTLDGTGTVAALGQAAASWSQVSGPTVTLSSTSSAVPTFQAPPSMTDQAVVLRRSVTDYDQPSAKTQTDDVQVTIKKALEAVRVGGAWKPARISVVRP